MGDILEGKRQKIADDYLSFKAYAVAAADKVEDYVSKGQGRGMSSIGDLCLTVGSLGAVHAPAEEGVGMGGDELPAIFSGKSVKVSNAVGHQRSRQRVHRVRLPGPQPLANGSRQVPPGAP